MRIKEDIERSGYFWSSVMPNHPVYGTMTISDGGVIELEANGLLIVPNNGFRRIVGRVEKDGYVTLDGCYEAQRKLDFNGGISKTSIHVGTVFSGVAYDDGETPFFNDLTFSVEGLDEWVGLSGIRVDVRHDEQAAEIAYQKPEDVFLQLENDMQLLIMFHWSFPSGFPKSSDQSVGPRAPFQSEAKISQKTYLKLTSQVARELPDLASVVQKIVTLLCFATDRIVSVDKMWGTSENLRGDIGEGETEKIPITTYYRSRPYSREEPKISWSDMLFRFNEVPKNAETIIKKWIKAYEKIEPTFNLYFSAKMASQQYVEDRFSSLVHGLEAYHRRTSNKTQMDETEFTNLVNNLIETSPEDKQSWLRNRLKYGNELSLRQRIKRIIAPYHKILGAKKARIELIDSIVNARNYLTHYDLTLESRVAKGADLAPLCQKMELIFQLHFLHLIGFSQEEIISIVENSKTLRWKCNRPLRDSSSV